MLGLRDRLWRYRYILYWGSVGPMVLALAVYLIAAGHLSFVVVGSVLALAAGLLLAAWAKRVDERRR